MLEEDSYDGEFERLHDQDWTKATTAPLRAAEGSRLTEKPERKMQSSKSGGEHTLHGMIELMPKQAAGHRLHPILMDLCTGGSCMVSCSL